MFDNGCFRKREPILAMQQDILQFMFEIYKYIYIIIVVDNGFIKHSKTSGYILVLSISFSIDFTIVLKQLFQWQQYHKQFVNVIFTLHDKERI